MSMLLKFENVNKSYYKKTVLEGLSFELERGKIIGLVGPNGSGKTTILRMLAGLVKYQVGTIKIDGLPVGYLTKNKVAFMPDHNLFDKKMTVGAAIAFYKDFYKDYNDERSEALLAFYQLDKKDKIQNLSKGNVEKLLLLVTLSREAQLYVLDEPLGGIDPVSKNKIINSIIDHFDGEDSSVLISTHLLKDTERIFDEVLFLKEGQIVLAGNCDDLRETHGKTIEDIYIDIFS